MARAVARLNLELSILKPRFFSSHSLYSIIVLNYTFNIYLVLSQKVVHLFELLILFTMKSVVFIL